MSDQLKNSLSDGAPLAVCVYDCDLDYGQPGEELAPICFRVCCAFAAMRWGNSSEGFSGPPPYVIRPFRKAS